MKISARHVLTPEGFLHDRTVHIENGVIMGIGPMEAQADYTCDTCVPGLIDQHVHGGYGADVMAANAEKILRENIQKLNSIARYLIERETITGDEFMTLLDL